MNRSAAIAKARKILADRQAIANRPKICCLVSRVGNYQKDIEGHTLVVQLTNDTIPDAVSDNLNPRWEETALYHQIQRNQRKHNHEDIYSV